MKRWQAVALAALPVVLGILFIIGAFADWFPLPQGQHKATNAQSEGQSGGSDGVSSEAKQLVSAQCSSCHGADLKGAMGPNLYDRAKALSKEQIVDVLKNGKGAMPGKLVSGKEEMVAEYIKSLAK
ncbi:MAG: cytochrome c [Alicyclobacillaceae bacterium]|nr:cytochrome c [Alicyclobacillaceae bacterium]